MLSDCPKCGDTPCCCGYNYQHMTNLEFKLFIKGLLRGRKKYPGRKAKPRKRKEVTEKP